MGAHMTENRKECFKELLQQVWAEYEVLHAQVPCHPESVLLPLPPLTDPALLPVTASLTDFVLLPGSVENSESLRAEAGHPEEPLDTQDQLPEEEASIKSCLRRETSIETSQCAPVAQANGKSPSSAEIGPETSPCAPVAPARVARARTSKVRIKPEAIEIPPVTDLQQDWTAPNILISDTSINGDSHQHPRTPQKSGSEVCPVPPTPVANISPIDNGFKTGAIENPENIKEAVRRISEEIDQQSVSTLSRLIGSAAFKERGIMAQIAKSKPFDVCTTLMIILNSIWVAIDADHNKEDFLLDADPIFQVVEHFFCCAFCIELVIRFAAFRSKTEALSDPWFIFDAILVLLLVVETWVMTIVIAATSDGADVKHANFSVLRLLRVVRLARLARVMRAVPELCFMVKGVLQATRSVACTMGLLLGILYVFGIVLKQFSEDTRMGEKYFRTVPLAVFTLFAQGALLCNISILFNQVHEESVLCAILLLVVVVLTALTLMNMLIGVLCDVMTRVASMEKDRMEVSYVKQQIHLALLELDTNMDELIDREEFIDMLCHEKASQALKDVGVDVIALVDFADYYFQSDKHGESFDQQWSFDRFIEELMQLRGVNAATVKDAVELRKFIHSQNTSQNAMLKHLMDSQAVLARNQAKIEQLILRAKYMK